MLKGFCNLNNPKLLQLCEEQWAREYANYCQFGTHPYLMRDGERLLLPLWQFSKSYNVDKASREIFMFTMAIKILQSQHFFRLELQNAELHKNSSGHSVCQACIKYN